ncbi:TIGR02186 family protein [Tianweitania sediminis]|uniref:TIGR02186 family protein n=1 Tax=Tianweitania sediminis TaxID=1502156 RepID=UPI00315959B4|nr:TIGR02186 family protein [Tianweitania sediminis]
MKRLLFSVLAFGLLLTSAQAQTAVQPEQAYAENIQIGLSTDRITITTDFSGADLTIFGALNDVDPQFARQNRYDVVVVLEGPARPVVVRRKDRVLGMWINTQSETFVNVPISYSVATTRPLQDIAQPATYQRLSLGADYMYLQPRDRDALPITIEEFTAALRERKETTGLYSERIGGVQFLSPNLFRATLELAPNVPLGTHRARAFLFKQGLFVRETSAYLAIQKSGLEQSIYRAAHDYSLLYGIFAVALAIVTGWLGRLIFSRD